MKNLFAIFFMIVISTYSKISLAYCNQACIDYAMEDVYSPGSHEKFDGKSLIILLIIIFIYNQIKNYNRRKRISKEVEEDFKKIFEQLESEGVIKERKFENKNNVDNESSPIKKEPSNGMSGFGFIIGFFGFIIGVSISSSFILGVMIGIIFYNLSVYLEKKNNNYDD